MRLTGVAAGCGSTRGRSPFLPICFHTARNTLPPEGALGARSVAALSPTSPTRKGRPRATPLLYYGCSRCESLIGIRSRPRALGGFNPHRWRRRLEDLSMDDEFPTPVGLIGLGAMGMGVARSLLRAGLPLYGYDVRPEALAKLAELGGHPAENVAESGASCRVVMLLVVNAAQTEEVIFGAHGLAETLPPGSVIVTSATVPPQFAADLGRRIAARGLLNIDAPVSGGVKGATEGRLSVMASGPARAFETASRFSRPLPANSIGWGISLVRDPLSRW